MNMNHPSKERRFAVCVKNDGYEVDLDVGTVYVVLSDDEAAARGRIRVIDESGEDYLYPQGYFNLVELSQSARQALSAR